MRDVTKPAAQQLRNRGVEVVSSKTRTRQNSSSRPRKCTYHLYRDATDIRRSTGRTSLPADRGHGRRVHRGCAQYLIFSAMVHAKRLHAQSLLAFDLKAEGENYICSLPVKSVLFAPWTFMQTFLGCQAMCPIVEQPSEKAFTNYIPVMRRFRPLKHELILGTSSGQHWLSLNNMLAKLSVKRRACAHTTRLRIPSHRVTGRRAKYIQLSEELWADFVDPKTSDPRAAILKFSENWGTMGKIQGRR